MIKSRSVTACPSCNRTCLYKYKGSKGYRCFSCGETFTKPKTKEMEYNFNSLPFALIHIMEEKKRVKLEEKKRAKLEKKKEVIIEKKEVIIEKQIISEPITSITPKQKLAELMRSLR